MPRRKNKLYRRIQFKAGDRLRLARMGTAVSSSLPATNWMKTKTAVVIATESGSSGGLDVYDALNSRGKEVSFYGTSVQRKMPRRKKSK